LISIQNVLAQVKDFPTLPTIYSTLLDVMANPRSTVQDVANVITKDIASSAKILKTVNSSIYGIQVKIDTISQAIFHLGFNEVKNLVIALSIVDMFAKVKTLSAFNIVEFWKHSIAVACISRMLGTLVGIKNVENFFLAGIVHDIGKLFFLKHYDEEYIKAVELVQEEEIYIKDAETKIFGLSHLAVGDLLAEKWSLPPSIRNTIKNHTTAVVNGQIDLQVACVHLANVLARSLELGFAGDDYVPEVNPDIWGALNIPPNSITQLLPKILTEYEQSVSILLLK
jgi:putative nucleotidyltransferase with HDIG domain